MFPILFTHYLLPLKKFLESETPEIFIPSRPIGHFPRTYRNNVVNDYETNDKVRFLLRKDLVS